MKLLINRVTKALTQPLLNSQGSKWDIFFLGNWDYWSLAGINNIWGGEYEGADCRLLVNEKVDITSSYGKI